MNKHIGLTALVALAAFGGGVAPALAESVPNLDLVPFPSMTPTIMVVAENEEIYCGVQVELNEGMVTTWVNVMPVDGGYVFAANDVEGSIPAMRSGVCKGFLN